MCDYLVKKGIFIRFLSNFLFDCDSTYIGRHLFCVENLVTYF